MIVVALRYLMKMPGLNRKVRITAGWLLHLLFPPELAQTKVAFESGIHSQHFEPGDMIFHQGDLGDASTSSRKANAKLYACRKANRSFWRHWVVENISGKWRYLRTGLETPRSGRRRDVLGQ
jgi:hypothetical protein